MKAERISLEKAKSNKLFYVVGTVIPYRASDGRCLILKRSENEAKRANPVPKPRDPFGKTTRQVPKTTKAVGAVVVRVQATPLIWFQPGAERLRGDCAHLFPSFRPGTQ